MIPSLVFVSQDLDDAPLPGNERATDNDPPIVEEIQSTPTADRKAKEPEPGDDVY